MESEKARINGTIRWQGSPANVSVVGVEGDITLKAEDGRMVEFESAGGALRLFALGNFSSLSRRVRLDFSDLFKKGYSYDLMKGQLTFNRGEMLISEPLVIEGPSANFKVEGRTDLINEIYDQKVLVVLPLGDNLPIAAAIAGAPQVGIPLWLINKAFGNMFDRFTSIRYRVTGPWEDPQIEIVKGSKRRSPDRAPIEAEAPTSSTVPPQTE